MDEDKWGLFQNLLDSSEWDLIRGVVRSASKKVSIITGSMETSTVTILRALFEHIVLFGRHDSNNKHYKCGKTGIGSAIFGVFIALLMLSMAIVVLL